MECSSYSPKQNHANHKRISWILYLSGFLDLCGVGLILSLLPSMARSIGASTTLTGIVGSVYGGVQLVSSPIMGKWADGVSRKSGILVSLVLSSVGYGILGLTPAIAGLVLARVVLGCFKHSQTMSKAYLADILTEKERSAVIGRFNSFSSMGFVIGPSIGGHLAETSVGLGGVALASALLFAVNAGLVWAFLPGSGPTTTYPSTKQQGISLLKKEQASGGPLLLLAFWDLFVLIFLGTGSDVSHLR